MNNDPEVIMEKSRFFPEINGNFGFGCMRLPMIDKDVDLKQFCDMTDAFIGAGFNYFDTAHGYIDGLFRFLPDARPGPYQL